LQNSKLELEGEKFDPNDIYSIVKGLLEGLRFPDVDNLMKCINNVPNVIT